MTVGKKLVVHTGTIDARVGKETIFNLTFSEDVHGTESTKLGIALTTIVCKIVGTSTMYCSIVCGRGLDDRKVTVNVVA